MPLFHVTYEITTEESAESGEAAESGFLLEDCPSLREALSEFGYAIEADSWPISLECPPRWFIGEDAEDYRTGERKRCNLHMRNVTPSSAMRIARLLGVTR
jgi:hypothetical protein